MFLIEEEILDFKSNTLSFKQNSIHMLAHHNICIQTGQTQTLTLKGKLPKFVRNNVIVMQVKQIKRFPPILAVAGFFTAGFQAINSYLQYRRESGNNILMDWWYSLS